MSPAWKEEKETEKRRDATATTQCPSVWIISQIETSSAGALGASVSSSSPIFRYLQTIFETVFPTCSSFSVSAFQFPTDIHEHSMHICSQPAEGVLCYNYLTAPHGALRGREKRAAREKKRASSCDFWVGFREAADVHFHPSGLLCDEARHEVRVRARSAVCESTPQRFFGCVF